MKRPLIGIPVSMNNNIGISREYFEYFSYFGDVIGLPLSTTLMPIDLLVLPGGSDICPSRYAANRFFSYGGNPSRFLEYFDTKVLPLYVKALEEKKLKGIFGICRGLQTLNVHFGGTLYQHLLDEPTNLETERYKQIQTGLVYNLKGIWDGKEEIKYNSMHHQAINKLPDVLIPTIVNKIATYTTEGGAVKLIEGIRHKSLPIFGVQYHPEEFACPLAGKIINHIINL